MVTVRCSSPGAPSSFVQKVLVIAWALNLCKVVRSGNETSSDLNQW
jgi:hypothetical protein